MSEGSQPFTDFATKSGGSRGGSRTAWVVAGILGVLLLAVAFLWASTLGRLRDLQPLPARLAEATNALADAIAQNHQAQDRVTALETQVAGLEQEKARAGQSAKDLEAEMRSQLESKDVAISRLQGRLTLTILDRVLFDSGEAVLRPDGESVLRQIATFLAAHADLKIQVIGHTDNVPIRSRFASNWELSTARALAAVHFLTEQAALDPRRVGAAGYGEYRPIADNSTAEGRARNRRIAITILPDEFAAADAAPAAKPDAANNPPNPPAALPPPDPALK